jgi:hypothetical protein
MQNPAFMNMAEKLGTQLMQDPQMAGMLQVGVSCSARHQPSITALPQTPRLTRLSSRSAGACVCRA